MLPVAIYFYLAHGRPPVAAGDKPFPMEEKIVAVPLDARIKREAPAASPIPARPGASLKRCAKG